MTSDDPLRQVEARGYQRRRRRMGLESTVVDLVALVAIVAATPAIGGAWAVLALVIGLPLLGLPFGLAGYRLARAHGLSRQTTAGWAADPANPGRRDGECYECLGLHPSAIESPRPSGVRTPVTFARETPHGPQGSRDRRRRP